MLPIVFLAALVDDGPVARPSSQQVRWADMEIGMFIHFAPNTWQDREGDDLSTPLSRINPAKLDTDQWAQAASDLGAKYVVLVTKHVGGFCLWQTDTTDYGIKNSAWKGGKGDVVADLAASCRKRGLALGFYVSPMSLHDGTRVGGAIDDPAREKAYAERYRTQLEELLTRYGPVFEVWFDGNTHLPVGDVLDKFGPKAVCFQGPRASIRWVGNEEGVAPYPTWNSVQGAKATTGESVGSDGNLVLRNSLTTLGIGVGVASLVAMLSLGIGLQQMANRRLERSGLFDTIMVTSRRGLRGFNRRAFGSGPAPAESRPLDENARLEIARLPNVLEAYA